MKIGELAQKTGSSVETIRYYEKQGLLPKALRGRENNYRYYDDNHLDRLLFIRRCRALDMSHVEIKSLLLAMDDFNKDCDPIDMIISEHLTHVQQRIAELTLLETQLKELNEACNASHSVNDCGILQKLTSLKD